MLSKMFKVMSVVLCFSLIISIFYFNPSNSFAAAANTPWGTAYNKVSDPDTSDASAIFSQTTLENGRLWTDKTVDTDTAYIRDIKGTVVGQHNAKPDEFLVTLSALSESYDIDTTIPPIDAVFIIDLSGSMTYQFGADTEGDAIAKNRRIDGLVEALNAAINELMDANPENRVAVVGYGGLSGRHPKTYSFLGLSRYAAPNNEYFTVENFGTGDYADTSTGNAYFTVNGGLTGGMQPTLYNAPVNGGTPMQQGIYDGAQIFMNIPLDQTIFTDPDNGVTVGRQPIMILMTDGEPTFGWSNYVEPFESLNPGLATEYEFGDAITPDMGIDILTVATASYWKQQVQGHYNLSSDPSTVKFYTIGVVPTTNVSVHMQSVLDPAEYAQYNSQSSDPPIIDSTTNPPTLDPSYDDPNNPYLMNQLLAAFIAPPMTGSVPIPIMPYVPFAPPVTVPATPNIYSPAYWPRTLVDIDNPYPTYPAVTSYSYTDGYYQATNADALKEVFTTIASQVSSRQTEITQVNPGLDPDFSGYLTFSDVLGQYLEFKSYEGLWWSDGTVYSCYNGMSFAKAITDDYKANDGTDLAEAASIAFINRLASEMEVLYDDAMAVALSSIAGGSVYYNSDTDWGNQIKWYADNEKYYIGPYYTPSGTPANPASYPPNAITGKGAMCIMDLYPITGAVTSNVSNSPSDLSLVCFVVLTALYSGSYTDLDYGASYNLTRTLVPGQQVVRWYLPANMIPLRTVAAELGNNGLDAWIVDTSPIRAVYSVGLQSTPFVGPLPPSPTAPPLTLADIDSTYKSTFLSQPPGCGPRYDFYTNQFNLDSNLTTAFCQIAITNPYYYFLYGEPEMPVYVDAGNGTYVIAGNGAPGPYYIRQEYFDSTKQSDGYINARYVLLTDESILVINSPPIIPNGTPWPGTIVGKGANITDTRYYVTNTFSEMVETTINDITEDVLLQIRQLGNDGRFSVPISQVIVEKQWFSVAAVPIEVQLYSQAGSGPVVAVDSPVTIDQSTGWRYTWYDNYNPELLVYDSLYPNPAGNVAFIDYTVVEITEGNWPTSYRQPVWDASRGLWSIATITNGYPPTPGNNADTGDNSDMLFWWLLLNISLLGLCLIYKARERYLVRR